MTIDYLPWNRPAVLAGRVCMRDTNAELTYAEVARRVDAVAGQFAAAGVGRGDVVAVMLPNRVELLLGLMAAWRLGAAATPVNPVFTANEAGYQIADSAAKLLLAADARRRLRRAGTGGGRAEHPSVRRRCPFRIPGWTISPC